MKMSADLVQEHIDRGGMVKPFNAEFFKLYCKRPPVDSKAITDPLNRFFSYGLPEYGGPILVRMNHLPQGVAL